MSIINPNGFAPLIKAVNYLVAEQKNIANPTVANGTLALDYSGDGKFNLDDLSFLQNLAPSIPFGTPERQKLINQYKLLDGIIDYGNAFESNSDQEQEQIAITLFDYNGDKA